MNQHEREPAPGKSKGDPEDEGETGTARSAAEWTTLGISLVILLSIFGLVTSFAVSGDDQPATISVEALTAEVRFDGGLYYVAVEVTNRGDHTVEDVVVEAELDTGSGTPITADFTIVFLAGGERVQGTFVFEEDPRQGELTAHAVSYIEP